MRIFADDYVQVRYTRIFNDKVSKDLKILVIGDVHISDMVSFKKIDMIKKRMLMEKVDYIVFVGDLIDRLEELDNKSSFFKLKDLLLFAVSVAKTFVVLGNHDYIYRKSARTNLDKIRDVLNSFKGVCLLDNKVYIDDNIMFMGYTETFDYYNDDKYNFKAFYDDFLKHDLLYKKCDVPAIALTHSPEFSFDKKCAGLFDGYDLILCGHTHDGCVPFGVFNFNFGVISPKKKFFPKNIRGVRKLHKNYIIITGGAVKIQECASKLLHPLNHLCPVQMDVVTLSFLKGINIKKKWY